MENEPSASDRVTALSSVVVIAYLAAHAIWRQLVFGEYSFVVLRIAFLVALVVYLLKQRRGKEIRPVFVGNWWPSRLYGRDVLLVFVCTVLCRWGVNVLFAYPTSRFTVKDFVDSCVIAPVNEEMVFRGVVLGSLLALLPTRPFVAVAVSALIFAGAHDLDTPGLLVPLLLLGLLCGWGYARTRSIPFCILCHVAWNAAAYLPFLHRAR